MFKKITILSVITLLIIYFFPTNNSIEVEGKYPPPTELVQKKKDRKKFKKGRKEYYKKLHKTAPDVDWKKLDMDFRREKSFSKTELRRELLTSNRNVLDEIRTF